MNTRKRIHNSGFTLVEILIVVVILGILSAIVIPQFTNASEMAKASAITTQLQTIRSQLELYRVQHEGIYPTLVGTPSTTIGWDLMTKKTTAAGTVSETGAFGPYLQKAPTNPYNNVSTLTATAAGTTTDAWVYDNDTGSIKGIVTQIQADAGELTAAGGDIVILP